MGSSAVEQLWQALSENGWRWCASVARRVGGRICGRLGKTAQWG
ncbi:hypothetical protein [Rhodococcus sp. A14]